MKKKYEFTGEITKVRTSKPPYEFIDLHQIKATKEFTTISGDVIKPGDIGGWIENSKCLSRKGKCWVGPLTQVYDNGKVCGDAYVTNSSSVIDSVISGKAYVVTSKCIRSKISGKPCIDNSQIVDTDISGFAKIHEGNIEGSGTQYITMGPFFNEYYITFYKGKDGTLLVHANKYIGTASGFIWHLRSLRSRNHDTINYNKQEVKIFRSAVKTARLILSGYSDKYKSFLSSHIVVNEHRGREIDEDE